MYAIKLEGAEELRKRMAHIKGGFARVIRDALTMAAREVETEAKRQVTLGNPKHLKVVTGYLRNSLTTKIVGNGLTALVGTNTVYAAIHEFGGTIQHRAHSRLEGMSARKVRGTIRMWSVKAHGVRAHQVTIPARPYLGPAMQIKRPAVERTFARRIRELLDGR